MLYVSKKSGDGFEVHDTESKYHYRYTHDELKAKYDRGIVIKGCAYIEGAFTVTPVPPVYGGGKEALAKALLTTGSATGIKGLNLKLEGDKITLLSFEEEFLEYAYNNSDDGRFILTVPDLVNGIEEQFGRGFHIISRNFASQSKKGIKNIILHIDFPESIKVINAGTEFPYNINLYLGSYTFTIVSFNCGTFDRIEGNALVDEEAILVGNCNDFTVRSRYLGRTSLRFESSTRLYLPDTEILSYGAIDSSFINKTFSDIVLGRNIKFMDNFITSSTKKEYLDDRSLMGAVSTIHIPDDCDLTVVDLSLKDSGDIEYVFPYVFVMSDYEMDRFKGKIESGELMLCFDQYYSVLGVLSYRDNAEYAHIQKIFDPNEKDRIQYFSRYLTVEDIGSIVYMKLK